MHAFLIVGGNFASAEFEIQKIIKKVGGEKIEFPLTKIGDARELQKYTKLKAKDPVCIITKDIESASTETLNAFLKNLEEPQENITYILTSSSEYSVLPTISSRCQIIKLTTENPANMDKAMEFIELPASDKLSVIDKIKDRQAAINFITELLLSAHTLLILGTKSKTDTAKLLKKGHQTLNFLKANGNVGLQLTNFVVNL